jgi:putative ABC transport system permease protein
VVRATLKGLLAHKLRLVLTALAVVLGVGFIAGTFVLTDTMNKTFDELFTQASQGIDVYVRSRQSFQGFAGEDRKPLPERLLEEVRTVEGVDVAIGSVSGYAQLLDKNGDAITTGGAPTIGASLSSESFGSVSVRDGRLPQDDDEVAIDAVTARTHGFRVGDKIRVLLQGPARSFRLTGIIGFGEVDNLGGATLAGFDLDTAQRVLGKRGVFDSIEVAAAPGLSPAELRDRVAERLPPGTEVATASSVADEQADAVKQGLGFFNTALLVFAAVALFVGAFIIFNTFSVLVAQRTRELGLLRALGASGAQVMASVVLEALVVGLVASAVGLAAGIGIALGLNALLAAFGLDLPSTTLQVLPRTVIVSLAVGTLVTVASAVMPARRAARISPMAALREAGPQGPERSTARILVGMLLAAAGVGALGLGLFGEVGNEAAVVGAGAFIVFLGVAVLSPLFSGRLARLVGAPLPRILGMPGTLARENAARNPRRTAATASALMVGLALVSFVAIFAASLKASSTAVIDESLKADFIVSPSNTIEQTGFSPRIAERVREEAGVEAVAELRFGEWRFNGASRFATGANSDTLDEVASIDLVSGNLETLEDGGIFLYGKTARDLGLDIGDKLTMQFAATGRQQLPVEGLFSNNTLLSSDYLMSLETFRANFTLDHDQMLFVKAAAGASLEDVRSALTRATEGFPNVTVEDQAQFREKQVQQIDQVLALVSALLGLALLIALLGITNTLSLSVFERTRELGLLRAVGMTRAQTRGMIRWESMIIAIIGALLGLVVGTFFAWALVGALGDIGITELSIPGGQLALYVVAAALAGVLAALPPARRAGRLDVLRAIAFE